MPLNGDAGHEGMPGAVDEGERFLLPTVAKAHGKMVQREGKPIHVHGGINGALGTVLLYVCDHAHTVQAAIRAARLRLRPILMTSFAFIMGVVPLVLSSGAGAEMRHAMGIAVFFGMLGVTFFGLFLTPVFYVLLRALEKRVTHTEKVHHHV